MLKIHYCLVVLAYSTIIDTASRNENDSMVRALQNLLLPEVLNRIEAIGDISLKVVSRTSSILLHPSM